MSYKFGVVGMLAGSLGVPLGSGLAQRLRAAAPDIDPNICGLALLASAPLVYLALVAVQTYAALTYLLIFLGMLTLNLTWAIVADMILVSGWRDRYDATDIVILLECSLAAHLSCQASQAWRLTPSIYIIFICLFIFCILYFLL